jgi:hypothetical protein
MGAVRTAGRGREVEASPETDWTVTVGLEAIVVNLDFSLSKE